jgi:predicted O-methyltransferase YrrM
MTQLNEQTVIDAVVRVPGWLNPAEARELFCVASALPDTGPVCCEIGSWLGRSSVAIGLGLSTKSGSKLFCVDLFDAENDPFYTRTFQEHQPEQPASRFNAFLSHIRQNHLENVVIPLSGRSSEVGRGFSERLDFLFIDGDHAYPAVLEDFLVWSPFLKEGGIIAFHDFFVEGVDVHVGPRKVIRQFITDQPGWDQQRVVDTLFIATKSKPPINVAPAVELASQPLIVSDELLSESSRAQDETVIQQ